MQNWPYIVYLFFSRHKLFFTIGVIAICGILGFYASKIQLDEDITRFVPKDKNTNSINLILQNLKSKDKLVIHLQSDNPDNIDKLVETADHIFDSITKKVSKSDYLNITYKISENTMNDVYGIFYNNLPFFLTDDDYARISGLISPDSIRETLRKDYEALLSPSGLVLSKYIQRDPLNIVPLALKKLNAVQLDENFETYNNTIVTKDHKHMLMFVTPAYAANETAKNKPLITTVKNLAYQLSSGEVKIEPFGACMVSLGNAEQLQKDTFLTTTITIILIALLIGIYFKNPLPVIFIFLPVGFGMIFSLSILFLFKGVLSAIAVAAGASVLGIAINYSLHFFTHFKHVRNIKEVISDLTTPMLIGCTTTVGAFFGLMFTQSEALHDFGQFAGLCLIGALLFSVFVLPHLLKISFKTTVNEVAESHAPSRLDKLVSFRLDKNKWIALTAFVVTVTFSFFASDVDFESDMNKMSFMDEETKLAEQHLDEVNNFAARSVYIFSAGKTINEALQLNEFVNTKLDSLKQKNQLKRISSVNSVYPSLQRQKKRLEKWNSFFTPDIKDSIRQLLVYAGIPYKFRPEAFSSFYELLNKPYTVINQSDQDSLNKFILRDYVSVVNGRPTLLTHIKVDADKKEQLYELFKNNPEIVVFDRQRLTSQFVDVISSDFSTILWITSILVFGFMLLSHGRIELAIINFLPMFVSWIWILGLMSLLGIKFNVINVIISTFIFGLGDDYSIFIMDGLLNEYKYGKKNLNSYKSSIVLSALTTIIGIGVMVFAKHPALQSIAAITIVGMICVVLVSFIIQPLIFNWMVLNRKYRGLQPYTFKYLMITVVGFTGFMVLAVVVNFVCFLVITFYPGGKRRRKLALHYIISKSMYLALAMFFNVKKRIINVDKEDFSKPGMIISNHQSHIDLALTLQLDPKIIVFTKDYNYNNIFYGWIIRMADYYPASMGYEKGFDKLEQIVKEGYSILVFPEGTRSEDGEIHRFHKGAFLLAEKLQIDIIPVLLHGSGDTVTKRDFHFKDGALTVKILPRISFSDKSFGETYQERTKSICSYMRKEYDLIREEFEPVEYFRSRLINNYIFKGPVLEWYCRIKTKLEDNYRLFESLMPKKGKIVDVGCGYGFLPYILMYKSKQREILGLDYDADKIAVATNCVHKNDRINFETADVTKYEFPDADGFIISDVLHYLEPQQQVEVLKNLVTHLNKNGVLVIRDADADLTARQKGTWYTEFFSTNLGFNKTKSSGLHFVSGKLIRETLSNYPHLKMEVIDNTKLTSNITYVIRYN